MLTSECKVGYRKKKFNSHKGSQCHFLASVFPSKRDFPGCPERGVNRPLSLSPFFFSLSLYTSPTTNATMARGRSRNANKRSVALNAALSIGPRKFRFKMCICRNAGKFHILALRGCLEGTSEGTEEAKWRIVESRKVDSSHTSRITGYILPNTCQFGASITYRGCYVT